MKNPERVAELLAELRELANIDFERNRIDALKQDLSEFLRFDNEQWREIEGYPDYKVSNLGRVASFKANKARILYRVLDNEYVIVSLSQNNKRDRLLVHRLVAQAFIPNPDNKPQVNHINGIKSDNRVENLEWVTASENRVHSFATGLQTPIQGANHYRAKFTNDEVIYIRKNPEGLTQKQFAEDFGVNRSTIATIQLGKTYKNVR